MKNFLAVATALAFMFTAFTVSSLSDQAGAEPIVTIFGHNVVIPGESGGYIVSTCVSPGNCVAAAFTITSKFWSVSEVNGKLGSVVERSLPSGTSEHICMSNGICGTATLAYDISCSDMTHCVVTMSNEAKGKSQFLIFEMRDSSWGQYEIVETPNGIRAEGVVKQAKVSCWSTTQCEIFGNVDIPSVYEDWAGFVVSLTGTTLGTAHVLPVISSQQDNNQYANVITCIPNANWCEIAGQMDGLSSGSGRDIYVGTVSNGIPNTLETLNPPAGFNLTSQQLLADSMSCSAINTCSLRGKWINASHVAIHAVTANSTNGVWTRVSSI